MRAMKIVAVCALMLLGGWRENLWGLPDPCLSVQRLFTDDSLVLEPAIVGAWTDSDGNTWTFQQAGEKSYDLVIASDKSDEKPMKFEVHLVGLGGRTFLNATLSTAGEGYEEFFLLRLHVVGLLQIEGNQLRLGLLDGSWLKKTIAENSEIRPEHLQELEGSLLLTAPTEVLQRFALLYGDRPEAFPLFEESELRRRE